MVRMLSYLSVFFIKILYPLLECVSLYARHYLTELCEVAETDAAVAAVPIQYQCLECLALFDTAELWMAHRQTHKISTHSDMSDTVSMHALLLFN